VGNGKTARISFVLGAKYLVPDFQYLSSFCTKQNGSGKMK
jgi:hypothetical protein